MKAFVLKRYGKKVTLQLTDIATPSLGKNEVLVQVHAAGVNLLDSKLQQNYFNRFTEPFLTTSDLSIRIS